MNNNLKFAIGLSMLPFLAVLVTWITGSEDIFPYAGSVALTMWPLLGLGSYVLGQRSQKSTSTAPSTQSPFEESDFGDPILSMGPLGMVSSTDDAGNPVESTILAHGDEALELVTKIVIRRTFVEQTGVSVQLQPLHEFSKIMSIRRGSTLH